jgi:uncharacterized Fe-S cluster-containing protein
MKAIDPYALLHIKIQFTEWNIIFKTKIGMKLFRFENKKVLQKIYCYRKNGNNPNDIIKNLRQAVGLVTIKVTGKRESAQIFMIVYNK